MSNTGMHGSRYWTEENWEYAFLVPQDTIDENYTGKIHNVLKEFAKTLYVRSDSNSLGWEEVRKTAEMPELENDYGTTGWTLSSKENILSGNGVMNELEKNLQKAECACSFMRIEAQPENETGGDSEVDLEEDSRQPSPDETTHESENVKEKSEKKRRKKQKTSKKSNKVSVEHDIQAKKINILNDRKNSQEASIKHDLISYKVVLGEDSSDPNVSKAWNKIRDLIRSNKTVYRNVKPISYRGKKRWHSWHKSWVRKFFEPEDDKKYWLVKLNTKLATELEKDLEGFGFTIEKYGNENSKSAETKISHAEKTENSADDSMPKPKKKPRADDEQKHSRSNRVPPKEPLPDPPARKQDVETPTPQINDPKGRVDENQTPTEKAKNSGDTDQTPREPLTGTPNQKEVEKETPQINGHGDRVDEEQKPSEEARNSGDTDQTPTTPLSGTPVQNEVEKTTPQIKDPKDRVDENQKPTEEARNSGNTHQTPREPLSGKPDQKVVGKATPQINAQEDRVKEEPVPSTPKSSGSPPSNPAVPQASLMKEIRSGIKLKNINEKPNKAINANREDKSVFGQMRAVMETRRQDIADDDDPEEGSADHEIMKVLTTHTPRIYVAMLQLTVPYSEIKKGLSSTAMCPGGSGKMWLAKTQDGKYEPKSNITDKIDEKTLEECAITGKDGPQGWYVKVITEIESDEWDEDGGEQNFLPSVTQMDALLTMQNDVSARGARLVNISTPFPELKTQVKNPPTLPTRKVQPTPVPTGFATLDSFKPKPNNRNVKTLVLVNYDNIRNSKELLLDLRTKLKKSTRKYDAFDVNKANKTLSEFKNGTLIGARGMQTDKNYRNVLENPVVDNYKNDALYNVELWNLEIPEDTTDVDIAKLRDELAKCGIAIRKDWRKSKV